MISHHRLRYFREIILAGSVAEAARRINVAQPALSHHVRELEEDLGTKLMTRSVKGVEPTEAGRVLMGYATQVMGLLADAENEVKTLSKEPHGRITVAIAVTLARQMVPEMIRIGKELCPKVDLRIVDVASTDSIRMLGTGQVDLALVPIGGQVPDASARLIYKEPAVFVRRTPEGRQASREPLQFSRLAHHPLVLTSRKFNLRQRLESTAVDTDTILDIAYVQDGSEILRSIVMAGLAGTVTQETVFDAQFERPQLDIRPLVGPEITRSHSLIRPLKVENHKAYDVVEEVILTAIERLITSGQMCGELVVPGA